MPFCTECGHQNPDDARFCSQCGHRLVPAAAAPGGGESPAETTATITFGAPSKETELREERSLNDADAAAVDALPPGSALPAVGNQDHWRGIEPVRVRISNLFRGLVAQSPSVSVETIIRDPDGALQQIAVIMPADRVSQALADQRLPQPWVGAILDRNGTLVARSRDAERFVGRPATPDNVARVRGGVAQGVFESVSLDGVATVIGASTGP